MEASRGHCANCGNATHFAANAIGERDRLRYCRPCHQVYVRQQNPAHEQQRLIQEWAASMQIAEKF